MAHTYSNIVYHIVFSTKDRLPLMTKERRSELFAYIGGLVKEKNGKLLIINGMDDHVHLLVMLPATICISDAMRFIKANSSRWMKERFGKPFAWQTGFGVFSVSRSGVETVAKYIRDQEIHHRKFDFRTEFVALLNKNGVEYDPEYLWR
ncbi:MAG: IS200/IS605 family transposase [Pyrinomonadaceae bacterium]